MNALKAMNRTYIGNNCINVRFAHRDKDKGVQNQPSNNIYVCNLPKFFGEAELYALFSPHGAITSLIVLEDRKTGMLLEVSHLSRSAVSKAPVAHDCISS